MCVLSCVDINSASVVVGRGFNATSKKQNNTAGISIGFHIKNFLKKRSPPPWFKILMRRIRLSKLLLVTAAVNLVLQLDLWARKCFSFIFVVISNTLHENLCNWEVYLELKAVNYFRKKSWSYMFGKGSKYTSSAVSVSCLEIKRMWR